MRQLLIPIRFKREVRKIILKRLRKLRAKKPKYKFEEDESAFRWCQKCKRWRDSERIPVNNHESGMLCALCWPQSELVIRWRKWFESEYHALRKPDDFSELQNLGDFVCHYQQLDKTIKTVRRYVAAEYRNRTRPILAGLEAMNAMGPGRVVLNQWRDWLRPHLQEQIDLQAYRPSLFDKGRSEIDKQ